MKRSLKQTVALCAALCLLCVGGLAAGQSIAHSAHHAHHHPAAHATIFCSWLCTAGQGIDSVALVLDLSGLPIAWATVFTHELPAVIVIAFFRSRAPPSWPA